MLRPANMRRMMSGTRIHIPTARKSGIVTYEHDGWPKHIAYIGGRYTRGGYKLPDSPWKNPYNRAFRNKEITREEAVARYREYILNSEELLARLGELEGKTLACWCALDVRCHGDVLLELLQEPRA